MRVITCLVALLFSSVSAAEQSVTFGKYTVHYNAFNSTAIDAAAASKFNLVRSKFSGMLNVAVIERTADGTERAVRSFNSGTVNNLIGQQQSLNFVPIEEGSAIYYIASFRFGEEEQLNFNIQVQPDPNKPAHSISLSQKFYADN
ncbi:MAG: DUF4426 domain-containing protein [Pseudomonadales bacterium]